MAVLILFCIASLFFLIPDAFSMEEPGAGRMLWDNIMMWVNFGILVLLFVKYGDKPLRDFLDRERSKIETSLSRANAELSEARAMMDAEVTRLKEMDKRLMEAREMILELGRREKEKIIQSAEAAANQMIADAERESEHRLAMAKKALKDQIVDTAVSIVKERLREGLDSEDDRTLVNQFIASLKRSEPVVK
jgi:F-type H+-transporting ATPase subunit b